jgi:hypothetical protein
MDWENYHPLADNEIEDSYTIDENQLKNAKIFSDRYKYIDSLPKNLKYLEIGVAWGGYSEIFVEKNNKPADTLTVYGNSNWVPRHPA